MIEVIAFAVIYIAIFSSIALFHVTTRLDRLIDLLSYGCDFEGKACEKANGDCSVCNFGNCDAKQVRELPTIIEADKESEG